MSDIRFNQWLHNSGTGGVSQVDGGHVGIGTTNPLIPVGSGNTSILNVGVVTANSFYGSGANLTGLPAQATIANNANNRVITGGSGVNLNGESNLTFDGAQLFTQTTGNSDPLVVNSTYANKKLIIRETSDANSNGGLRIQKKHSTLHPANYWYGDIAFQGWDGDEYRRAGLIECVAVGTPSNNNMPGELRFSTNAGAASQTKILTITKDGSLYHTGGGNDRRYSFASDGTAHYLSFDNTLNGIKLNGYGGITFETNGTNERLRIDSSGNMSLGYAGSPASSNGNVTKKFGIRSTQNNVLIGETSATSEHTGFIIEARQTGRSGTARIAQINMGNDAGADGRIKFQTAPDGADVQNRLWISNNGIRSYATFVDTSYHANPDPLGDGSGIAYYRLNYNFQDSGRFGNHGQGIQGGDPTFALVNSSGEPCWNNPTDGAINLPNLKNSYPFSMAAWINVSSWPTSADNDVIMNLSIGSTRVTLCICCWSSATSDGADFYIMYGGQGHHYFRPTSKPTNTWIHVVYSVVGSDNGGHRVYQNGADLTTRGNRGGGHGGSAGWAMGGNAGNSERFAMGRIGSIRFFNKALTASEANTLYQNDTFYT